MACAPAAGCGVRVVSGFAGVLAGVTGVVSFAEEVVDFVFEGVKEGFEVGEFFDEVAGAGDEVFDVAAYLADEGCDAGGDLFGDDGPGQAEGGDEFCGVGEDGADDFADGVADEVVDELDDESGDVEGGADSAGPGAGCVDDVCDVAGCALVGGDGAAVHVGQVGGDVGGHGLGGGLEVFLDVIPGGGVGCDLVGVAGELFEPGVEGLDVVEDPA